MTRRVTFDRIGRTGVRSRGGRPVDPLPIADNATPDEIAEAVHKYARPFLASRDIDVIVDGTTVTIFAGLHTAGTGTIEEEADA